MIDGFDFSVLLQRKRQLVLTGLVVAIVAFGTTKVMPRSFASNGGMIVENSEPNVPELGIGVAAGGGNNDGIVLTQVEILRSRGLIDHVVRELDLVHALSLVPAFRVPVLIRGYVTILQNYITSAKNFISGGDDDHTATPTDAAVDYVQKHLTVKATEHSSVVALRFQTGSPVLASQVLNKVMDAYLAADIARRQAQIGQVNSWLEERTKRLEHDADLAAQNVEQFVRGHNLPEVQGSSVTAWMLNKDQDQLAAANQVLVRQQAILNAALHGGATTEVLESKTIQAYRDAESKLTAQLGLLTTIDPRRAALEHSMVSIRQSISSESDRIITSLGHNVDIANANVSMMQAAVKADMSRTLTSSIDAAALAKLKSDADAKRQMFIAFGTRTQQTMLAAAQLPSARVLFAAAPERPSSFGAVALLFGFVGGVFVSIAWIILRQSMNTTITSPMRMTLLTGLPVLGILPEVKRLNGSLLFGPDAPAISETLRGVWVKLRTQAVRGEGTTVLVTSSEVGEGKTTVAVALASRIVEDGYRVLLIDGDLRRHCLADALGLRTQVPLEAVLNNISSLAEAAVRDPKTGLECLLSDGSIQNPLMALSSPGFEALLAEAKRKYDFVVLDSPPVLRVADPIIMTKLCERVLFIVRADSIGGDLVNNAVQRFDDGDRSKILTLLTRARHDSMDRGHYFSGYPTSGIVS